MGALCAAVFLFLACTPFAEAKTYYYTPSYTPAYSYTYAYQNNSSAEIQRLLEQVYALMAQLQSLQAYGNSIGHGNSHTVLHPTYGHTVHSNSETEVFTDDADIQGTHEATVSGAVRLGGSPYADVWFQYGTNGNMSDETRAVKLTSDRSFDADIDGLSASKHYYFRAVAENASGYLAYGSIMSFDTDGNGGSNHNNNSNDDEPEADTQNVGNVGSDYAELRGDVDMNDFDGGRVFFVYGQDRNAIEDVEDEDSYSNVEEDGDDIQKEQVYTNLDDSRSFEFTPGGLDDDTDYYYRICVGFEDEDGDDALSCGEVEDFTTDND